MSVDEDQSIDESFLENGVFWYEEGNNALLLSYERTNALFI